MRAPATIVTLLDDDGDEFPIRLDGVTGNAAADYEAAMQIADGFIKSGWFTPNGKLRPGTIEQIPKVAATQEP